MIFNHKAPESINLYDVEVRKKDNYKYPEVRINKGHYYPREHEKLVPAMNNRNALIVKTKALRNFNI